MEFSVEVKIKLTTDHTPGEKRSKHVATDFNLIVKEPLDHKQYFSEDGMPNLNGSKMITNLFIQGLVGNIHQAHEKGFADSASHLRFIISEPERGFAAPANVSKHKF